MAEEVADLVDEPEPRRWNIQPAEDFRVEIDVPRLVDRECIEVQLVLGRILELVDDDRVEGEEGAGQVRGLMGSPDSCGGPRPPLLGTQSVERATASCLSLPAQQPGCP